MELLTSEENGNWTALLAAVIAAFLIATGAGYAVERLTDDDGREAIAKQDRRRNPRIDPDEPEIAQAPWKIKTFPAPGPAKVTKEQREAVQRIAPDIKNTVQDLYDALTISRTKLESVARKIMPPDARSMIADRPLVPRKLSRVKTLKRAARIAIDGRSRASAAARVQLSFRADSGKRRLTFDHEGILWLERGKKRWRVIGFDIDQKRKK